jgi:hypothetical protein
MDWSAEKEKHGLISRKERAWIDQQKRKSMDWSAKKKEHGLISRKERAWIDQQKRKTWIDQQKRKNMDWSAEKKQHGLISRKERAWIDQQKRKTWIDQQKRKNMDWFWRMGDGCDCSNVRVVLNEMQKNSGRVPVKNLQMYSISFHTSNTIGTETVRRYS